MNLSAKSRKSWIKSIIHDHAAAVWWFNQPGHRAGSSGTAFRDDNGQCMATQTDTVHRPCRPYDKMSRQDTQMIPGISVLDRWFCPPCFLFSCFLLGIFDEMCLWYKTRRIRVSKSFFLFPLETSKEQPSNAFHSDIPTFPNAKKNKKQKKQAKKRYKNLLIAGVI